MTIQELRNILEQRKGKKLQLEGLFKNASDKLIEARRNLGRHEEAREIIREVAIKTQQQLQYHIADITSLALEAVYEDPYELIVEFVQRRNKTECDLYFVRDGNRVDPLDASGGGVVNVAAFALRVASWSMQQPRSNNILILDEPFVNVSTDLLSNVSQMIKEVSSRLGLQILMATHDQEFIDMADKVFSATRHKGVTVIT